MRRSGLKEAAFPCIEIYTVVTFPSYLLRLFLNCPVLLSRSILLPYDVVLQENNASSLHTTPQFL